MSFQWPLLLPLLAIVPLSVAAYVALERRRAKYAVRFTNLEVLAGVVDERRAWRRWLPPVLFFMALAAALLALSPPGSDGRRAQGEGKRHPHHRQLGLDVREGRASHPARGCPGSRAAVPRQAPRSVPGRRRDVLLGGSGRRAADARPPGRARRRRVPVPGTRDGDRRRAREVRRARRAGEREGARRDRRGAGGRAGGRRSRSGRRPRSSCSRTAPRRPGSSSRSRAPSERRPLGSPYTRSPLGRRTGR